MQSAASSTRRRRPVRPARAPRALGALATLALLAAPLGAAPQAGPFDPATKQAQRDRTAPEERGFLVDVGARLVLPRAGTAIDFVAGRAEVYLQFDGPLETRETTALMQAGVRFDAALRSHTYLARITERALATIEAHPRLRGVEPVLPMDKLSEVLYSGIAPAYSIQPDGTISALVRFHDQVSLEHALAVLERWQVKVEDGGRFLFNQRLAVGLTHAQALVLAEEPTVRALWETGHPEGVHNVAAAALSNVDDIQAAPYGLDGTNVRIGEWDGGDVVTTHPDLAGRVTTIDSGSLSDHATHVAGTMVGDGTGDPTARGMAPAAQLFTYTFAGDEVTEQVNAIGNEGISISNHSWGRTLGWHSDGMDYGDTDEFGAYLADTADWDALVRSSNLLVQKSSGNDRDDCNPMDSTDCDGALGSDGQRYDTIGPLGIAKNIVTVGAVDDAGVISGFSSSGPTDDGRIKPDIVANGTGLNSTWAGGVELGSCGVGTAYCSISGTSMSTPTVSGAVALLTQLYRQEFPPFSPRADTIKALLVNTATDMGTAGPDYLYGHGLLDAQQAADTILVGPNRMQLGAVDFGGFESYLLEVPSGTSELRLALAWVDVPGAADSTDPDLINDLDLQVFAPDGTEFFPFTGPQGAPTDPATNSGPNRRDNVESTRVTSPMPGIWSVNVIGAAVPIGPQIYTLVSNTSFYLGDLPNIEVAANLNFPEVCVDPDSFEKKSFSIYNTGGANLLVHDVQVASGAAHFELLPFPSPPFVLPPGASIEMYVVFEPDAAGPVAGQIEILSNDADESLITLDMSGVGGIELLDASIETKGYFGRVKLGDLETRTVQVLNSGTCDLEVISMNLVMGSTDFATGQIDGFPAFPFTLFPGEAADVFLEFQPTAFGFQNATFQLVTSDPTSPILPVAVSGDCPPPDITLSGSLDFGEVCPGEMPEKVLQVCNTGLSDLEVTSVAFDPPCDDFEIVNNPFPNTVSHDFCLPVTIRYTPTGVGMHSCTLVIESNDPDEPTVTIEATGTLLPVSLDVSPDVAFPPTVIQGVEPTCVSYMPFPVTNNGECPVTITDFQIVQGGTDYAAVNLPTLPLTLLPGEQLGDGLLMISFKPENVVRYSTADVEVTYETNDPMLGDTDTITRFLCGEGVNTGFRLLVTRDGVPMPIVDKIQLFKVLYPDTVDEAQQIIQIEVDVPLMATLDLPPCVSQEFHTEYGGETNPILLQPGHYDVWINHQFPDTGHQSRKVRVIIDDQCTFLPYFDVDF